MLREKELAMIREMENVCLCTEDDKIEDACNQLAKDIQLIINCFGVPSREIAEGIQGNPVTEKFFKNMSLLWINFLAYAAKRDFRYDGRNEYSVKTGSNLYDTQVFQNINTYILEDKDIENCINAGKYKYLPENLRTKEMYIISRLYRMHRTLFQTFSRIVFCFLDKTEPAIKTLVEDGTLHEEWWRCPMI